MHQERRFESLLSLVPDMPLFQSGAVLGCLDDDALDVKATSDCTLRDIYDSEEYDGKLKVQYVYDRRAKWAHFIRLLGRGDPYMPKVLSLGDGLGSPVLLVRYVK